MFGHFNPLLSENLFCRTKVISKKYSYKMSVMDFTEWDFKKEKALKQMLMKSNEIL